MASSGETESEHVHEVSEEEQFHDSFAVLQLSHGSKDDMVAKLDALAQEEEALALQVEVAKKEQHIKQLRSNSHQMNLQDKQTEKSNSFIAKNIDTVPPLTTKSLPKNPEMEDFVLDAMDLLSNEKAVSGYQYAEADKTQNHRGKYATSSTSNGAKYFKIKDFVRAVGHIIDEDEVELCGADGRSLFVKNTQSARVRNMTVAQWISANLRIMKALIAKDDLNGQEDINNYLKYTSDIGDLLQVYPAQKVIAYDDYYRQRHAEGDIEHWGDPCQQGVTICLQVNFGPSFGYGNRRAWGQSGYGNNQSGYGNNQSGNSSKAMTPSISAKVPMCRDYNARDGCHRDDCKFIHECNNFMPEGGQCTGKHPRYLHSTSVRGKQSG
jgi:hypothetical protein